jgi:hypothetical protein
MPVAAPQQHHQQHAMAAGAEHVVDAHSTPTNDHPIHKKDGCQTACCLTPAQAPARLPEASAVGFSCAVRYVIAPQFASSRAYAPDPEIPKHLA